ncbi:MAG: N-acetyltransferase [Ahrensia sp.]
MTRFTLGLEAADDAAAIETLHEISFGPGRFARAAFRLREQGPHDPRVSYCAHDDDGQLLGSVRMTWVQTSGQSPRGMLLGPLAVQPTFKNFGIGKALVRAALDGARDSGADYVLLVGDPPYYEPLGFQRVTPGQITLPGPFDPRRLVIATMGSTAATDIVGLVSHA